VEALQAILLGYLRRLQAVPAVVALVRKAKVFKLGQLAQLETPQVLLQFKETLEEMALISTAFGLQVVVAVQAESAELLISKAVLGMVEMVDLARQVT
jgi:hypothetical protein